MSLELPSPLVSPAWVAAHLDDPSLRVVDCRWYLLGPKDGREEYEKGHIPGAVFIDVNEELAQRPGPGRHPLPGPERFTEVMRRIGVDADTAVVAYDDAGGSIAARLWWMLGHYGHANAALLDGGIPRWIAEGRPLEQRPALTRWGSFTARAVPGQVVDREAVARRDADTLLIDARAAERYSGELEPIDARAGHIPGAINVPFSGNLRDGSFMPAEDLRARYTAAGAGGGREVIVYCGSGVTACHDLLALKLAGIEGAKLYVGSWSDWSSHADAPIAVGLEP